MKAKRILSFILTLCLISVCFTYTGYADNEYPKRKYYNINVIHTPYHGVCLDHTADFMVLTDSQDAKPKVYIKAEDFSSITSDSGYHYEYNQTYTECAFVSKITGHVIRFSLNSSLVSVFYACDNISYTAPYDTIYEDGVTWIPFEFATKLLYMEAFPVDDYINITSVKYSPFAAISLIHSNLRDYAFDPVNELCKSEFSNAMGSAGASMVTVCNRLLTFEPSAWGSTFSGIFGKTTEYDYTFADKVAQNFILPSEQEVEASDTFLLEKFKNSGDTYDMLMTNSIVNGKPGKTINDVLAWVNNITEENPRLAKTKGIQNVLNLLNNKSSKKVVSDVVIKLGNFYDRGGDKLTKGIGIALVEVVKMIDFYKLYKDKNDRAVAALKQYSQNSKYEEKTVFSKYYETEKTAFLNHVEERIVANLTEVLNDGALTAMGSIGLSARVLGFAWSFMSKIDYLEKGINGAELQKTSEYAIKYQDESLGFYFDYCNKLSAENGNSEQTLDEVRNALYAYLKFSYVARNSSAGSHLISAELLPFETKNHKRENGEKAAEILNQYNMPIAELLTYIEQDIFTPNDANEFANTWDDTVFVDILNLYGTPIKKPSQTAEPIFEFPEFPGENGLDYIAEEEAIEIAKRTVSKMTGGLLETDIISSMIYEVSGENDIITYHCTEGYIVDDVPEAYIVEVKSDKVTQMLLFVSVIGNEVWLGTASDSSPGGYYVYKELDLLHADRGDYLAAIGDLTFALVDAYQ
ncbi:MAG: hypothetical protein E7583_06545 [Ruminococcaceae bacterium]|nr:hypothetical protein [Oscillospiraceae bacterium]